MTKAAALVALFLSLTLHAQTPEKTAIDQLLTQWHQAAADADFQGYFGLMAPNSVFIGTDASENWDKDAFMSFSKPYFDQGRAWSFRAVQRNIYLSESGQVAWFDELLDTWMQLCRGSGVAVKTEDGWRIAHYVLSMTMPNEEVDGAVALKREKDSLTLRSLTGLQPKN
ncbi:nuclear transport factor 2 family protein [Robiginitalea sediminis]|uniref:nuclear transport factor 2 family protein n=1 Tax=Robiginitalea sediminis TaxID=1982593 RepID=UPI000B4BE0A2|nr:nuclear transport factor 2 family protein [Robiginitalea sediminis]